MKKTPLELRRIENERIRMNKSLEESGAKPEFRSKALTVDIDCFNSGISDLFWSDQDFENWLDGFQYQPECSIKAILITGKWATYSVWITEPKECLSIFNAAIKWQLDTLQCKPRNDLLRYVISFGSITSLRYHGDDSWIWWNLGHRAPKKCGIKYPGYPVLAVEHCTSPQATEEYLK